MRKPGGRRMNSSVMKATGVSERGQKKPVDEDETDEDELDVYEYEEGVPEEERRKNKRFDEVERLEYELPSDFEDEEIDEDAAFGVDDSDIEAASGKGKNKRRKLIDLNSDEGSESEDDDDAIQNKKRAEFFDKDDDEEAEEDDEEAHEEDEELQDGEEDDGDEEEEEEEEKENDKNHRRMLEAVTGNVVDWTADRQRKRGHGRVVSEAYPESEFNLNPTAVSAQGVSGITVEDLMTPLQDTAGFGTIRKRMQQLRKSGAPVDAPLPKILQDRLDRKAGYAKTSQDITKWQPIVKSNREAPILVFNKREPAPTLSIASLASHFTPTTDLEKEVKAVLRQSKLIEEQNVQEAEALELNKLTVQEVQERQERLAKMRHLLFRHEVKAKRVKKIKSKTFHKLLQKDHKSKAEANAAVAGVDPEAAKAAALKREFNRAQERMTLKHKNSTRWAKRILKRGLKASENDGTRDAIAEQLRTHAALTRKINTAALSVSDNSSSDSEEENEDVVSGLVLEENSKAKILAKAKVATLKALEDGQEGDLPSTGIFSLPFMTRAIEKKKKAAENDVLALLEQLEQAEEEADMLGLEDDSLRNEGEITNEASVSERNIFGAGNSLNAKNRKVSKSFSPNADEEESGDEILDAENSSGKPGMILNKVFSSLKEDLPRKVRLKDEDNSLREMGNHAKLLNKERAVSFSNKEVPAKSRNTEKILHNGKTSTMGVETVPSKVVKVSVAGRVKEIVGSERPVKDEAVSKTGETVEITNGEVFNEVHDGARPSTFSDDDSDADPQQGGILDASSSQQDLIRQAFAGDDVEAEFEKVKTQLLDEEVPQGEGPLSLPGWGQWTRVQQKKGQPAWLVRDQEKLKSKRESELEKRKDAKLKHVIISEKQDKKAAKFTAPSVPFPFTSREVFERSIRMPIGPDYNTGKSHRNMIRPAVIKSAGFIIDPIQFEKSSAQNKEHVKQAARRNRRH